MYKYYSIISLVILLLFSSNCFSQTQKGINYQAVARNSSGDLLANKQIGIRFTLIQGPLPGTNIYIETHTISTNQLGLFTAIIGKGEKISGDFSSIDWKVKDIFLKIEIDPNGGTNFSEIGTTLLQAVPYALIAEKAANDNDTNPVNELQNLIVNGNQLSITNGNTITIPNSGEGGDHWGSQTVATDLSLEGNGTLSDPLRIGKNSAKNGQVLTWVEEGWLPRTFTGDNWGTQTIISDSTIKGDGTESNPIKLAQQGAATGQVLVWTGNTWLPASNSDTDADVTNEIQTISIVNDSLKLSKSGGSVKIKAGATSIDELSDGKTDAFSVFLGSGSGNTDDGNNYNTAVGISALASNGAGEKNTGIGYQALRSNSSGFMNTAVGYNSMNQTTSGYANTSTGNSSLSSNLTGNFNSAFGTDALFSNTSGYSNAAFGAYALAKNTSISNLVAVGDSALYNNGTGASGDQGTKNTAIGSKTLLTNTTGKNNTATGYKALASNTIGQYNTAIGSEALIVNNNGSNNTAIGSSSLFYNNTGSSNTAIGAISLFNNIGSFNVALGYASMSGNTSGWSNVVVGAYALNKNTTISNLVAVGDSALYNNGTGASGTQGYNNTAVGSKAMFSNTIGSWNTAVGYRSLYTNTSGLANTAFGVNALLNNLSGSTNSAFGTDALANNSTSSYNSAMGYRTLYQNTSGEKNTATGYQALRDNNTGFMNTAVGYNSMYQNTSGYANTSTGNSALSSNLTGNFNVAFGTDALYSNSSGWSNVAVGAYALNINTIRGNLVAIGDSALNNNGSGSPTGDQAKWNTAVGSKALLSNTTGNKNVAIGTNALLNATGNKNIAIGYNAGIDQSDGSNNIYIGSKGDSVWSGMQFVGESDVIRIGTSQTKVFIKGIYENVISGGNYGNVVILDDGEVRRDSSTKLNGSDDPFEIWSHGNTWILENGELQRDNQPDPGDNMCNVWIDSDGVIRRVSNPIPIWVKTSNFTNNIDSVSLKMKSIHNLIPITFSYKNESSINYGFKLEDITKLIPEAYPTEKDRESAKSNKDLVMVPTSANYPLISVMMVNEIQTQKKEIDELKARIKKLEKLINEKLGE